MPPPIPLPAGLTTRPLTTADAPAVFEVMAASELADLGEVVIEEADIVADWQRPSYDLATRSLGVLDGDRLVASAELTHPGRADVSVHPDVRGRGIGTALAGWVHATARGLGASVVGQEVPEGSPGDRLLASLGCTVAWTSWVLRLPPDRPVPARPLPEGYVVRAATAGEREQVWTVAEDAFLEWSVREREPLDDFGATVWERPGFEPWHLRVAVDPDGAVAAVASLHLDGHTAYVDKLATRADRRHRGLAQALLADGSAVARSHGASGLELSTDSRTGALDLYRKIGMETTSVWVHRSADLTGPD
ncbi:GNAT family N-acetyltransferase [Nocardioides marmotae]|uniref:GNAT family N-acetyltransferase n=1 Tax=Nocardioides marmotae TaxID=2663857 RepID=UPI0029341631|nr:GNAT family N-acetyltransferase [Nocardioides marmotae]